jgi:hypothetical protein
LEEANDWLFQVCLEKNSKRHSGTGEVPFKRWIRIRDEMLVRCEDEELYRILNRNRYERQVYGDLTVRIGGEVWQLPRDNIFYEMIKRKVEVYIHPLEPDRISIVWQGQEYEIERAESELRAWSEGPVRHEKTDKEKRDRGAGGQGFEPDQGV